MTSKFSTTFQTRIGNQLATVKDFHGLNKLTPNIVHLSWIVCAEFTFKVQPTIRSEFILALTTPNDINAFEEAFLKKVLDSCNNKRMTQYCVV